MANHAGTFLYHSHVDEIQQVDRGLSGAFIIDPQDAHGQPAYDQDMVMLFSGWTVPDQAEGGDEYPGHRPAPTRGGGHRHDYNYWTINGKSFPDVPPITVCYGDRVRLRLINISQDRLPMHLHGHDFRVIAMDGHPLVQPLILNAVNVAPGQVDIDFIAYNPGRWLFHCPADGGPAPLVTHAAGVAAGSARSHRSGRTLPAHSDENDHSFQAMATTCSDGWRPESERSDADPA